MDLYRCLLVVTLLSLIFVAIYAFRANLRNIFITIGLFLTAMLFRSDYRLYFQFHPQRASAEPYFKFPGAGQ